MVNRNLLAHGNVTHFAYLLYREKSRWAAAARLCGGGRCEPLADMLSA